MLPKLLASWLPVSKKSLRRRHRAVSQLGIEYLEDRTMLNAALPPDIIVGRTLSAYTVAGVQNHSLDVTYTVYNETADDVTGVLLTTTLQPGVTFATASASPDRSGQDLAWSLGAIHGFDRASVTVTLTLPNTPPLQLDSGARAFGTLNAGMVTSDTPAATLVNRTIPADQLASTPDANWTDPFVQEQAAKLRYDPQAIFDYLNNEVGYESYTGSLRGARGTLWSAAGNSLDEASLGVALLRASGIPARYAHGTLSDPLSKQLILSMFPASFQAVGYIPAGTPVADPANDPQLLTETRDHYWVQIDNTGTGFVDADTSGLPGSAIGTSFTTTSSTFTEVADGLRHKVQVKLDAEIYTQLATAFGLGDGLSTTTVLDQSFKSVDLVGRPLSIGNFVHESAIPSPIFVSRTTTYTPYIVIGDEALPDSQLPEAITGTQYQEVMTNFPLGNQLLTGLFLTLAVTDPGVATQSYYATLVDRIGYAARQGTVGTSVSVDPNGPPAITPFDLRTLNILPGLQSPAAAQLVTERANRAKDDLQAETNPSQVKQVQVLTALSAAKLAQFAAASDQETANMSTGFLVAAYFGSPRITAFSSRLLTNDNQSVARLGFDLMHDSIRAISAPDQSMSAAFNFAGARGLFDSALEAHVLPTGTNVQNTSAVTILQQAKDQNIPRLVIGPSDLSLLQTLDIPADAIARITTEVEQGLFVEVPARTVMVNSTQTIAWSTFNPRTGEIIAESKDGEHQGLAEYAAVSVIGTLVGAVLAKLIIDAGSGNKDDLKRDLQAAKVAAGTLTWLISSPAGGVTVVLNPWSWVIVALAVLAINDPPPPPGSMDLHIPFPDNYSPTVTNQITATSSRPVGSASGTFQSAAAGASGSLTALWNSTTSTGFQVQSLNASNSTIIDGNGVTVGSGPVWLARAVPVEVAVRGNNRYSVAGNGTLAFYAPAEPSLGVSGVWSDYTANVDGTVSITLTADGLTLNGQKLSAGTYTITTSAATLGGSGHTSSPNFAGSASITATNSTVTLGTGAGAVTVGGSALDLSNGATLTGYTGSLTVAAGGGGNNPDSVTLNGTNTQVVHLSATNAPAADQNTPTSFQVSVNTSLAGNYTLTAEAPPGWTVTIDATGHITARPAPGLRSGTYQIRVVARSAANSDLVAQVIVPVAVTATAPGLALSVDPDTLFTVPTDGGAQSPTAFRASLQNLGPAADTYTLTFPNPPAGFTIVTSGTSDTVPAGETGILGVYLKPNPGTLPAPGTSVTFTVTATSTSNPSITQTKTVTFVMPSVHGLVFSATPAGFGLVPGGSVQTAMSITSVGNVSETVNLSQMLSTGLTATGLPASVNLTIGQTLTTPVTLTADAATPLNSTLAATFTAKFNPLGDAFDQTVQVPVRVVVPGADALASASVSAQQLGFTDLGNRLNDLATAVTNLFQHPGDPVYLGQALAALDALIGLVRVDPYLVSLVPNLTADRDQLANASDAAEIGAAIVSLGNDLVTLNTILADEIAHRFTLGLLPNTAIALPGAAAIYDLDIINAGTQPTTYDLTVAGLPGNVSAVFNHTSITLQPGGRTTGANRVTLSLTETGTSLLPAGFTISVVARGATEIAGAVAGSLTVRPEFVNVASVTATPPFGNPGTLVGVSTKLLNAVNTPQVVKVSFVAKNAAGVTVFTSTPVSTTLDPQTTLTNLNLGNLDTTGFATGSYTLVVTVTDTSGTPLPGGTGTGTLLVGSPVTGSLTVTPTVLPSGNAVVTNTLNVHASGTQSDLLTLTGQVQTTRTSTTISLNGNLAYVAGTNGIDVVDNTDPTHPAVLNSFGGSLIVLGGFTDVRRLGADKLVIGTTTNSNADGFNLLVYDLAADPTHPALVSNTPFPYAFLSDMEVQGNTVLVTTYGFSYFGGGDIFNLYGDLITLDVSDPANPFIMDVVENSSQPYSGSTNKFDSVFVTSTTAYVASTTATGGDTDTGTGLVLVVRTADPANVQVAKQVSIPGTANVLAIGVQGNRALVVGSTGGWRSPFGSTDNIGITGNLTLSALDVTDPLNPVVIGATLVTAGTFPTSLLSGGVNKLSVLPIGGGLFAVSSVVMNGDPVLLIADSNNPANITANPYSVPALVNEMAVAGNLLYTTSSAGELVYTLHTFPAPLALAGALGLGQSATDVALYGSRAYVVGANNISVVDVTNPSSPALQGTFAGNVLVQGGLNFVEVSGQYLVVGTHVQTNANQFTLLIYDLNSNPVNPTLVGQKSIGYPYIYGMSVLGNTVYLAESWVSFTNGSSHTIVDQGGDFLTMDISNPANPVLGDVLINTLGTPLGSRTSVNAVAAVTSTVAYGLSSTSAGANVNSGVGRLLVIDTTNPANLPAPTTLDIPGTLQLNGIAVRGNRAVVLGTTGGYSSPFVTGQTDGFTGLVTITVLDTTNPAQPLILNTLVTENRPHRGNGFTGMADVRDLGNGLFAVSNTDLNGNPVVLLIDPTDPSNILVGSVIVPSAAVGMNVGGGKLYVTSMNGLAIYDIGTVLGTPVTISVQVPNGTGATIVANSFSEPPTQTIPGAGFDTLVWKRSLGFGTTDVTFTWQSQLTGLQPNSVVPITSGATIDFVNLGTPGSVSLPATTVSVNRVVTLSPATQSIAPAGTATFTVTLSNPGSASVTYALSVGGVPTNWVSLPPSATVPAGGSLPVTLQLTPDAFTRLADYSFTVTAEGSNGAQGSAQAMLTVAGAAPATDPEAHGIVAQLTPSSAQAGFGGVARYTLRLTNTGSTTESFNLTLTPDLSGVIGTLSQSVVSVPPGIGNFREVVVGLSPTTGVPVGGTGFRIDVASSMTAGFVLGTLNVLPGGVSVTLDHPTGAPGDTFLATVTNTGSVTDTYNLSAAGPAGLVSTLGSTSLTLAPNQSQTIQVTTGSASFAARGSLDLTVVAQSRTNAAVKDTASAALQIGSSIGLAAQFNPGVKTLQEPGAADFLLTVNNTGNTEDAYSATIIGTTGSVVASLVGLDGQPAQSIPVFRLPGLASGAIVLHLSASATGTGTATVQIRSLNNGALVATATATLNVTTPVLVGYHEFGAGADTGYPAVARFFNPDGSERYTKTVFPGLSGGVRVTSADFNKDGVADLVAGTGPGSITQVVVFDGVSGNVLFSIQPFEDQFTGGVFVAAGDLTGDGVPDLVITPDVSGGPRVRVFSGVGFIQIADFFGIDDPDFRGGARAGIGDVNGDGAGDLVMSAGFGGGPRIALFNGKALGQGRISRLAPDFFIFESTLRNGAYVAAGDLDGDGHAEVIGGGGPGGGPRVLALNGSNLLNGPASDAEFVANFFAGDTNNRGGVRVAARDLDGDNLADLVVGDGTSAGSRVTGYLGKNFTSNATPPEQFAFDAFPGFKGGVYVG